MLYRKGDKCQLSLDDFEPVVVVRHRKKTGRKRKKTGKEYKATKFDEMFTEEDKNKFHKIEPEKRLNVKTGLMEDLGCCL